ncbi:MAG: acyltransferase family protein [Pseudomonadales bacterium]|nr:acyltransferase family protein [Pseudomonadales bacterium]
MLGERKYFLDWLRVIAFALLILFHVGLLYVTWGYNLKSPRIFPNFELVMNSLSAWRLVLLFFISGVASRFLIEKLGRSGFAVDRIKRLVPVILLGILILNPTQVYVEFLDKGYIEPGYLDFWWSAYLPGAPFPNRDIPTWDHLWFLAYLLVYVLMFAVIHNRVRWRLPIWSLLMLPAIWLAFTNSLVQELAPVTQDFVNDWANHLRWLGIFGFGVVFAARSEIWQLLEDRRRLLLLVTSVLFLMQLGDGLGWRIGFLDTNGIRYGTVSGLYGWSVVLTLSGYAAAYLNRSSRALSYLTDAVLPIYVVHQPVLLIAAYWLLPLSLPLIVEVALLGVITGLGSVLIYEVVARRLLVTRFLFGLKTTDK